MTDQHEAEPTEEEMRLAVERARARLEAGSESEELTPVSEKLEIELPAGLADRDARKTGEACPHCGREEYEEFFAFTPKLTERFGGIGRWALRPCSPECVAREEVREWERVRTQARGERLIRRSELPSMYGEFGFETFDSSVSEAARDALSACRSYAEEYRARAYRGEGLVIHGAVGTGKSHLAVSLMREIMKLHGTPALFVTVPSLLETERSSYDQDSAPVVGGVVTAQAADLLILDDLGAERMTEWAKEKMFVLINHRYAQGMPTVITTNDGAYETKERIGERSFSRLAERCEWIPLEGEDYRMRGENE